MMAEIDPTLPGVIVALVVGAIPYLIAVRRFSGRVDSSDAADLWTESRSIREWSQARIAELNQEVLSLRSRVGKFENDNIELSQENGRLVREVHDLNQTVGELRDEVRTLIDQLRVARKRVSELEGAN